MAVGGGRAVVWAEQRGGGYGNRPQAFGLGGGGRGNLRVWQRGGLPPPRRGGSGFSLTFQNCSAVLQPTKVKIIKENGHFLNAKARLVAWTRIQSKFGRAPSGGCLAEMDRGGHGARRRLTHTAPAGNPPAALTSHPPHPNRRRTVTRVAVAERDPQHRGRYSSTRGSYSN